MGATSAFDHLPAVQRAALLQRLEAMGGWRGLLDSLATEWDRSSLVEKVLFLSDVRGLTGLGVTELLDGVEVTSPDIPSLLDAALDLLSTAAQRLEPKIVPPHA
jgi:hypothetical protein